MSSTDTIFAQSTAKGRSAIALHRISGPGCYEKICDLVKCATQNDDGTSTPGKPLELKHAASKYGFLIDENGSVVDDCVFTLFKAPNSYSGEETLEIACHGNPFISARLHSLMRRMGFRDALPGEFTQRAFLNGKIDLTRAEAIDQLIHADTSAGIELARKASTGSIGKHSRELRERLVAVMAYFEAHIDFAEDEVGSYSSEIQIAELTSIKNAVQVLFESYVSGIKIREGIKIVFLGEPNAGKSSLYNTLLGSDRAIVTDIPGTTRDVVEDRLTLNGRDFVLMDTAGVRETSDKIEKIGVDRSISSAKKADIVCFIIDPTVLDEKKLAEQIEYRLENLRKPLQGLSQFTEEIVVLSKADTWNDALKHQIELLKVVAKSTELSLVPCSSANSDASWLKTELEKKYDLIVNYGRIGESPILISQRQQDKAKLAMETLEHAISWAHKNDFPEKIASLLLLTAQHLADLVGEIGTEDVLTSIFSNFCIGK